MWVYRKLGRRKSPKWSLFSLPIISKKQKYVNTSVKVTVGMNSTVMSSVRRCYYLCKLMLVKVVWVYHNVIYVTFQL